MFSIYNKSVFTKILAWNYNNRYATTNTIDRYLESSNIRVVTTTNFLVGHKEDEYSTLWNFKNDTYNSWILRSSKLLYEKVNAWNLSNLDL